MSNDIVITFKRNNDNINGAFITMPTVYIAVNKMATFITTSKSLLNFIYINILP